MLFLQLCMQFAASELQACVGRPQSSASKLIIASVLTLD